MNICGDFQIRSSVPLKIYSQNHYISFNVFFFTIWSPWSFLRSLMGEEDYLFWLYFFGFIWNFFSRHLPNFLILCTAQIMKFSIEDFSSKSDQIRRKLQIWSHLLKIFFMEKFNLWAVMNSWPNDEWIYF